MIKVTMQPTIDLEDACRQLNLGIGDFEFTQMAENGSYVILSLDDETVEELQEDIEWEQGKSDSRLNRLNNQLALVNLLRAMGYTDSILVFIFW